MTAASDSIFSLFQKYLVVLEQMGVPQEKVYALLPTWFGACDPELNNDPSIILMAVEFPMARAYGVSIADLRSNVKNLFN